MAVKLSRSRRFHPLLAAGFAILMLVAACQPLTPIPTATVSATSTRTPKPTQKPKPTRTPTPIPTILVFESQELGLRLPIPEGYYVKELPLSKGILLALGFAPLENDQSAEDGYPISLVIFPKPPGMRLLDWLTLHTRSCVEMDSPEQEGIFFFDLDLLNQSEYQGLTARRYESGCYPVPSGILIDRDTMVVNLRTMSDFPGSRLADVYEQILYSLEFFPPSVALATLAPLPSATPGACLDASAAPRSLPPRQALLEVHFISDGNLWYWQETTGITTQVSNTGDAHNFTYSPDGQVIAFTRGPVPIYFTQTELWGIRRDGTGMQLLLSIDQLHSMVGPPETLDFSYEDNVQFMEWIGNTHTLGFKILRSYDAIGGCCDFGGFWQVDLDTGDVSAWTPPEVAPPKGPNGLLSPDGTQVAIINEGTLDLVNADGTNLRRNVFSFEVAYQEGGRVAYPSFFWAADSQSLLAVTFPGDLFSPPVTIWRIPVDGSSPTLLHTFDTYSYWFDISPDHNYVVYKTRTQPRANDYDELHLAALDGSKDFIYFPQGNIGFSGWHPDQYHFVVEEVRTKRPFLGSLCGDPVPLLEDEDIPTWGITWVDRTRFLFVKGARNAYNAPLELRLGQIGGPSIYIGPYIGDLARFEFNVEPAALGGECVACK
jgi:hypothetical protein